MSLIERLQRFVVKNIQNQPHMISEHEDLAAMKSQVLEEELKLRHRWVLWYHRFDDPSWDIKSYRQVFAFGTVTDFWRMQNSLPTVFVGMFFVMKEGILPMYEDDRNLNGGIWSFRVHRRRLQETWNDILLSLIGSTIYPDAEVVNGVSINPNTSVVKVWLQHCPEDSSRCKITDSIPNLLPGKAIFLRTKNGT